MATTLHVTWATVTNHLHVSNPSQTMLQNVLFPWDGSQDSYLVFAKGKEGTQSTTAAQLMHRNWASVSNLTTWLSPQWQDQAISSEPKHINHQRPVSPRFPAFSGCAKVDFALSKQTLSHKFKLWLSSQLSCSSYKGFISLEREIGGKNVPERNLREILSKSQAELILQCVFGKLTSGFILEF